MSSSLKTIILLLVSTHLVNPDGINNGTTVDDKLYDDWNDLAVAYYNWGTDESDTTPVFVEQEEALKKYKFAYRSDDPTTLVGQKKALTWALGIKGVDIHGRIYPDADCMGTLVNPKIIMTLCACVNSYYTSYDNLKPEDADFLHFAISPTSDEQFDIRAPNLVASRTSWAGFETLSGETEKFPISKQILDSPKCKSAILASENYLVVKQYKSVVFLKVDVPINHPSSPLLTPHYDFSSKSYLKPLGKTGIVFYGHTFQILAYFQEAFSRQKDKPDTVELVRVGATGETMDFGSQLMGTDWTEEIAKNLKAAVDAFNRGDGQKHARIWHYTCDRRVFDKYSDGLDGWGTDAARDKLVDDFANATVKPDVACFSLHSGSLCNAPPGSPVVYNGDLFGMTITRVTNCTKGTQNGKKPTTFALMMGPETGGQGAKEEIEQLANYLQNQDVAKAKALSKDLVFGDEEKGDADIIGNIDSDLVLPMAKFLRNRNFVLSDCVQNKPNILFLLLTMQIYVLNTFHFQS